MANVRIQDDLYEYVNGEWIAQAVIPDDRPVTGGFADLRDEVEKLLTGDLNKMCAEDKYPNEYLRKTCRLYSLVKDTKRRNKEGFRPVKDDLKKINKLKNINNFNRNLKELILSGAPLPFDLSVQEDMKHSTVRCLYISGPATILPDTVYYKPEMAGQHDNLIAVWKNMVASVLKSARLTDEEITTYIEDAVKFDEIIAGLVKSMEEWSDYTKAYNMTKTSKVCSLIKPVKLKKVIGEIFGEIPEMISVADQRFLKGFNTLFNEETFELYKHWAYINIALSACACLSEKLREAGSVFSRALSGAKVMTSVERYAYSVATGMYSGPVGLYYGETYFGEEAKKDVIEMVTELIETYKKRVAVNQILSDETKEKAILKLSTMRVKMGYPDKLNEICEKLVFDETANLYTVMKELNRIKREYRFSKLYKPVDRSEWIMDGHIVNACYNPTSNDITFPAAILQPPFYSVKQSRSANLGGIGAVIGHEISHAFDSNGAKIDENGDLNNWWKKEDFKRFEKLTKAMIKQFDGIVLPWGPVNAALTVTENMADNGGMAAALDIMSHMEKADYNEFFINWAKVWRQKARDNYRALLLNIDVHGPACLRGNMPPRNFEEWYTAFGVTKKDKMYIAPSKRLIIW